MKTTNTLHYHTLELGDVLYPDLDQRNMQTAENQISGLYQFVGPGVTDGWDIASLALTGNSAADRAILSERAALAASDPNSWLGQQYLSISSPTTDAAWAQVVHVTPGDGVVGRFSAATTQPYYFRFAAAGFYYVWAEASGCLVSDGICQITAPQDPQYDYDTRHTATFLGQVEVVTVSGVTSILVVDYTDRRQALKNLAGALQQALKKSFYHHVHLGGPDHPSKIILDTQLVLNASAPTGSTIFLVRDASGNVFSWYPANYGVPEVRLNNVALLASQYSLESSSGRLSLKNSVPAGAALQVILSLSPQVQLSGVTPLTGISVTLTDGTTVINPNDGSQTPVAKTWDSGVYNPAVVKLRGVIVSPSHYLVRPERGTIEFNPLQTDTTLVGTDLVVTITHIGDQIQGKLNGVRIGSVDAGTFVSGSLDPRRLSGLDHVGQVRYMEAASQRPYLRLLADGDHKSFYPEIVGSPLQFGSDVFCLYRSQNIPGAPVLLGTKRGLMQTSDMVTVTRMSSWATDQGEPVQFLDNLLAGGLENYFRETYLRTQQGKVFRTRDGGSSWQPLPMPILQTQGGSTVCKATAFWVSTARQELDKPIGNKYANYSTLLYLGTDHGLWTATVPEGLSDIQWAWSQSAHWAQNPETIRSMVEISTQHVFTSDTAGTITSYDHDLYFGADSGLYVGAGATSPLTADVVKGWLWIASGPAANDLLWHTDHGSFLTHTAVFNQVITSTSSETFWTHPLTASTTHAQIISASNVTFLGEAQRTGTSDYFVLSDHGVYRITDTYDAVNHVFNTPAVLAPPSWTPANGSARSMALLSAPTGPDSGLERYFLATDRGVWKTTDVAATWSRPQTIFLQNGPYPTVYDEATGIPVTGWTRSESVQSFTFVNALPAWQSLLFERDFQDYYVAPWNGSGADVVVYIGNVPTDAYRTLFPAEGRIHFAAPRSAQDSVQITIIRIGAYISNVGTTPHGEIPNSFLTATTPITTLAADFALTDQVIKLTDTQAIPVGTNYIELRAARGKERIPVTVDPVTRQVTATIPRIGAFGFPANSTKVFIVTVGSMLGIEDLLSRAESGQTYHLNSLSGVNTLQTAIGVLGLNANAFSTFTSAPKSGTIAQRGPVNALFFDFSTSAPDPHASSSTLYVGLEPSAADAPVEPRAVQAISGASAAGTGMRVGTDVGIWEFE